MPYNTRRKSLSLSELGIIVPKRARTVSHPPPHSDVAVNGNQAEPPIKKPKRSHDSASPPDTSMSPPRTTTIRIKEEKEEKQKRTTELSPPPSPVVEGSNKVDVEGISDEIVVETIRQLEKTGNRPHLVKELGAVLSPHVPAIERSANQSALISARLTAYLNRQWPAISPCPLAKDLTPSHPRRLYFYLTTMPRQPLPEVPDTISDAARVISPALSSDAADEEERDARQRTALSPSPEVDLSSPEFDEDTQDSNASNSVSREDSNASYAHNRRAASPQLEHEEQDFKQTANALYEQAQQRRNSLQQDKDREMSSDQRAPSLSRSSTDPSEGLNDSDSVAMSIEGTPETEDSVAAQTTSDVAALFGHVSAHAMPMDFSSPVIKPFMGFSLKENWPRKERCDDVYDIRDVAFDSKRPSLQELELPDSKMAMDLDLDGWDGLQSPETVELDELDGMFD